MALGNEAIEDRQAKRAGQGEKQLARLVLGAARRATVAGLRLYLTSVLAIAKEHLVSKHRTKFTYSRDRRRFLQNTAAAAAAWRFLFVPERVWGQLEKPVLGAIGIGGKGESDISGAVQAGFHVGAMVDIVDAKKLTAVEGRFRPMANARERHPQASFFTDYREMLTVMDDKIDAVTVSTPDHHHFHAALAAMQLGKHVYCQKPLTHGLWEARALGRAAKVSGVRTQMGNQAHATDALRRSVELLRTGVIGKIHEVHAWTNRPIWPQGFALPPAAEAVPAGIDWNQWVGPAPWADYSSRIAPFNWRGWWDYGTGALGDMACHIMDMPLWALATEAPWSVQAEQAGASPLSPPINSKVTWQFHSNDYTVPEGWRFVWYDGYLQAEFDASTWSLVKHDEAYNHPEDAMMDGMDFNTWEVIVVGDHGKLYFSHGKNWAIKSDQQLDGFEWPVPTLPRARNENSYFEWRDAIDGKIAEAESNFTVAGSLTETVLLGVLAQRTPETKILWDSEALAVVGRPDLGKFIRRDYRNGWDARG